MTIFPLFSGLQSSPPGKAIYHPRRRDGQWPQIRHNILQEYWDLQWNNTRSTASAWAASLLPPPSTLWSSTFSTLFWQIKIFPAFIWFEWSGWDLARANLSAKWSHNGADERLMEYLLHLTVLSLIRAHISSSKEANQAQYFGCLWLKCLIRKYFNIFTFDQEFRIYRWSHIEMWVVLNTVLARVSRSSLVGFDWWQLIELIEILTPRWRLNWRLDNLSLSNSWKQINIFNLGAVLLSDNYDLLFFHSVLAASLPQVLLSPDQIQPGVTKIALLITSIKRSAWC